MPAPNKEVIEERRRLVDRSNELGSRVNAGGDDAAGAAAELLQVNKRIDEIDKMPGV